MAYCKESAINYLLEKILFWIPVRFQASTFPSNKMTFRNKTACLINFRNIKESLCDKCPNTGKCGPKCGKCGKCSSLLHVIDDQAF